MRKNTEDCRVRKAGRLKIDYIVVVTAGSECFRPYNTPSDSEARSCLLGLSFDLRTDRTLILNILQRKGDHPQTAQTHEAGCGLRTSFVEKRGVVSAKCKVL